MAFGGDGASPWPPAALTAVVQPATAQNRSLAGSKPEDLELAAAIAASIQPNGLAAGSSAPQAPSQPEEPPEEEWDEAPPDAAGTPGAVVLRIRLPGNASQFQRGFLQDATLHQVLRTLPHLMPLGRRALHTAEPGATRPGFLALARLTGVKGSVRHITTHPHR